MPDKQFPAYTSPEDFLFKTPPYERLSITKDQVEQLILTKLKLDGYCPYCRQQRTFVRLSSPVDSTWMWNYDADSSRYATLQIGCTRIEAHSINFHYLLNEENIQKVGQFPSYADIALDESKKYDKLLSKKDVSEFHRAIGLAAHNIGIGSYVYLRRIFERLIEKRYQEFKASEGWTDEDYYKLRIGERVTFLKNHLPPFLVKNAKVYSILSLGIHELEEETCLAFFPVLRESLRLILEEDKKKKEELAMQAELERAIATFEHPKGNSAATASGATPKR